MNIRDIALLADVTPGTVSKVLNNYPDISEATRQHVLKIIEEYQYDPKANARSRKSADCTRIGLVVESVYNPLYSMMEDSLSIHIHNAGYEIVSFHDNYFAQDKVEKLAELVSAFEREKLCGLIYMGGNFEQVDQAGFDALPCPTIFVNTVLPYQSGTPTYSSVQASHFETAFAQMQHLIEQGHKHICMVISSVIDNSVYGQRYRAYRAALGEKHLEHNLSHVVETDFQTHKAYTNLLEHLHAHPETTAICCETDIVIPGVLRAVHDAGRKAGDDIRIISFDGLNDMKFTIPSITTFAQPVHDMVRFVHQLLFGLINKEQAHQHITFRPTLVKGESC